MLCDSNDRSCLPMDMVGSLAVDMAAGVAAGIVTGVLSSSNNP